MTNIKNEMYYVYMHKNKTNGKVYIGITMKERPELRWGKNGSGYKPYYGRINYFWNAIQKYGWDGFEHIILFSNLSKKDAEQKEIDLIKKYNSTSPDKGYNVQHGGNSIGCHNEATKKYISDIQKKKVYQYDRFSGQFIQMFESTLDAEEKLKIPNPDISVVCLKKVKTAHDFVFRYEQDMEYGCPLSEEELKIINRNDWYKNVLEYNSEGNLVCEYEKTVDVPKISKSTLYKCLNHKKEHYRGRIFRYSYEIDSENKQHIDIDFEISLSEPKCTKKTTILLDLNDNIIKKFNTSIECAKYLNVSSGAITYCVNNSGIFRKQYKIKYA